MLKKVILFISLCICTKLVCMEESQDGDHHEKKVLKDMVGILRRESLPEEDFRSWCRKSSQVLSESEKDVFKRLGSTLEDIHTKTSSFTNAAALIPTIISTVNTFVDAVKHHEPDFTFNWWEAPFVAPHVTPWAYKSICQSSEETK